MYNNRNEEWRFETKQQLEAQILLIRGGVLEDVLGLEDTF